MSGDRQSNNYCHDDLRSLLVLHKIFQLQDLFNFIFSFKNRYDKYYFRYCPNT